MMHGIWIDSAPSVVLSGILERLIGVGFDSVAICTSERGQDFPRWRPDDAMDVCLRSIAAGLEVTATVWLPCTISETQAVQDHAEMWASCGARTIELDVEGPWVRSHRDQARRVYDHSWPGWSEIRDRHDVAIGLTTHMYHPEAREHGRIFTEIDRYAYQCYTSDVADSADLIGMIRPGHVQTIGLGAYGEGRRQLRAAYDAAVARAPSETRWWSSRHVIAGGMDDRISEIIRRG